MTIKKLYISIFVLLCQLISAQNGAINNLKEVVVSDRTLYSNNKSQSIQILNDSVINKNQSSLTNLLNYNSVLYFKEYGRGMLSTVSFRGTTASQTAVIWNGINVNSQLNGSTDFNTFTAPDFNSVSIKAGGGSVSYGSGAIGGTVHLNNDLVFKNKFENDLRLDYGSFNTVGVNYKMAVSNKKWSTQVGFSRNSSDNDYPYVNQYTWDGVQRKNENGQYATTNLYANIGYKIKPNAVLAFYSQSSDTDRNLSLISESDSKTKYVNTFSRNLLEYSTSKNRFSSNYKVAYLSEQYQYFENIESDDFSFGKSESFIAKMDLGYKVTDFIKLNGILDYNRTKGFGTSFGNNTRQIGGLSIKAVEQHNEKWQSELGFRKEATSDYDSPFLFSLGTSYKFNSFYNLKFNVSRNFRIPTFNDLYWETGGNPDLKPESSYQAEIGNVFTYKKFTLSETVYFIKIKDLIRWAPLDGSNWTPENIDRVNSYGSETNLGWSNSFGKNNVALNASYAYTVSENVDTGEQLNYVPYHKLNSNVSYSYKKISATYQFLFNGAVTTPSQKYHLVKEYWVSNLGVFYDFGNKYTCKIGVQALNLFNQNYQSISQHYMPGRNFLINLTFKF
ncbi:TonB-dependent receptor plug domain-containing protein [Flavobacterium gilvum]|uniref:TonB-dependent receptor n=1 Tax=Flavobacterium gilvum TaxID=1492737 RepID=A0AAC9I807_9FLAO|nr:TonB-dependent receptor [Flavobacterium gilvum]AOW11106.1 TonB-dependent receptor [Flavobacterium gilvum]KFC61032.1 TonB-dependent outer membrane receptorprecursor [Flavobacterium gilvum]